MRYMRCQRMPKSGRERLAHFVVNGMLFKKSQSLNLCAGPPFLRKFPSPHAYGGVGQVKKSIRIDGCFLCFGIRGR